MFCQFSGCDSVHDISDGLNSTRNSKYKFSRSV
ncbi:MAG: hypothetical protein V8S70_00210 [Muribaculaceae bacterium]